MNFCEQSRKELLAHLRDTDDANTGNILIIPDKSVCSQPELIYQVEYLNFGLLS